MSYLAPFPIIMQYWSNITFENRVPLINALILANLCEYRHKPHSAGNYIFWTTFLLQTV